MAEQEAKPFTAEDIRFTVGGGKLHAFFLDWPGSEAAITSLGRASLPDAVVERVETIGGRPLPFRQESESLVVEMPGATGGEFVPGVTITGRGIV
jgi:alpha-L-fucosidase